MNFINTDLKGVYIIEPKLFSDERGYFFESFTEKEFNQKTGYDVRFVQDNESRSTYGVLRGLHYQLPPYAQSKLVRVVCGKILDVAVDLRKGSPTFGKNVMVELTAENFRQLFVPRGFAHGFVVLSDKAVVQYKCDNYYSPQNEGSVIYNDPALGIDWRLPEEDIILSPKDRQNPMLEEAKLFDYSTKLY